jgi:hypothetical protein
MRTAVLDTSVDAFRQLPSVALKRQSDRIFEVVNACATDLSLREIAAAYEKRFGLQIDISTVSARVNALIAALRVERLESSRPCTVSGKTVHPVRVPPKGQGALFQ